MLETLQAAADAKQPVLPAVPEAPARLNAALDQAAGIMTHDWLLLVVSDFDGADDATLRTLTRISHGNDIVLAIVHDPSAHELPEKGRMVVGDGRLIRFASHLRDAGGPEGWGPMRLMFLQYPSDPIVFYEPASFWRAPAWMREPPAPDVSPELRFVPVVTQFQLALDMALATTAPAGYGHSYYAPDYVGPWAAVTAPEGWTAADSARLARHCDRGFQQGCPD